MGLAFLISSDNLQLLGERKVLKEAEYAALVDAAAVIEAAHREARAIEERQRTESRRARDEARAEGLAEACAEQAAREVETALRQQRQLGALRDSIAGLVARAVAQLLGAAQADEPERLYAAALRRVDVLVREQSFIAVRVAPARVEAFARALAALHETHGWTARVDLQPDPSLDDERCVLQTAAGSLELGLAAQLRAFEAALAAAGAQE